MTETRFSHAGIREMHLGDLEQVIQIEHEIFLFPWSIVNFRDSIKVGHHCRVLTQPNTDLVMGYGILMIGPGEAHILTLGIGMAWQNQGLGGEMLCHLIELSRKYRAECVLLDVRESNTGATNLYQRLGFKQIAVRKGYYPAMCGRENALIMKLEIQAVARASCPG